MAQQEPKRFLIFRSSGAVLFQKPGKDILSNLSLPVLERFLAEAARSLPLRSPRVSILYLAMEHTVNNYSRRLTRGRRWRGWWAPWRWPGSPPPGWTRASPRWSPSPMRSDGISACTRSYKTETLLTCDDIPWKHLPLVLIKHQVTNIVPWARRQTNGLSIAVVIRF